MLDSGSVQVVRGTVGVVVADAGRREDGLERARGTNANDEDMTRDRLQAHWKAEQKYV